MESSVFGEYQRAVTGTTEHAEGIAAKLREAGYRIEVDARGEKMGKRTLEAEMQKVHVMLIVGDKDIQAGTVSVRRRSEGDLGAKTVEEILEWFT